MSELFNLPTGLTLTELTNLVTRALSSMPSLYGAWVVAELSDVRLSGGHCYMELIEKNVVGQTVAKMRATIWQSQYQKIRQKFFQSAGRDLNTGLKVLLRGNVTHHSIYGLSFNVIDIDPSYTLGDLERLRREILSRLEKEGILHLNKEKIMPVAVQRIAVISAEGAAGYGDFIDQLTTNQEGFVFYPFLFPCVMQGEKVSASIRYALNIIDQTSEFWDCVVIIRGGGATTDLNGFDDYELAKSVALCKLPVVVGIGHERDRNVLDEIANVRVKTPTAVAAFFIDRLRSAFERAMDCIERIKDYAFANLTGEERRVTSLSSMLPQLVARRLIENRTLLERISRTIPVVIDSRLKTEHTRLDGRKELISTLGISNIANASRRLLEIFERINQNSSMAITFSRGKLNQLASLVDILDPINTLKRGFSITRINGKALTNPSGIQKGDKITSILYNGEIESEVKCIKES